MCVKGVCVSGVGGREELVVAADVDTAEEMLELAEKVGGACV